MKYPYPTTLVRNRLPRLWGIPNKVLGIGRPSLSVGLCDDRQHASGATSLGLRRRAPRDGFGTRGTGCAAVEDRRAPDRRAWRIWQRCTVSRIWLSERSVRVGQPCHAAQCYRCSTSPTCDDTPTLVLRAAR